jgi:hypothetical protein
MRREAPLRDVTPHPTTNQVEKAIASWLKLCHALELDPGSQTNVASVFWPRTAIYTNPVISVAAPVCQVQFANGTCFEAINGVAFSHYAADACLPVSGKK